MNNKDKMCQLVSLNEKHSIIRNILYYCVYKNLYFIIVDTIELIA